MLKRAKNNRLSVGMAEKTFLSLFCLRIRQGQGPHGVRQGKLIRVSGKVREGGLIEIRQPKKGLSLMFFESA